MQELKTFTKIGNSLVFLIPLEMGGYIEFQLTNKDKMVDLVEVVISLIANDGKIDPVQREVLETLREEASK